MSGPRAPAPRRSGLVGQLGSGEAATLWFFPTEQVHGIVARPPVSAVPGVALGVALVSGRVAAVRPVGDGPDALLVDAGADGPWLLDGLEVVRVGWFDAAPDGIRTAGCTVPTYALGGGVGA